MTGMPRNPVAGSEEERGKILIMYARGVSMKMISLKLKIPYSRVDATVGEVTRSREQFLVKHGCIP